MQDSSAVLIDLALSEDIGAGDVTSEYFIPENSQARAWVTVRQSGTVSGVDIAARVFERVDPKLQVEILIQDGSRVGPGALLMKVEGAARSILTAERTVLNFLQRLSGVASLTAKYVDAVRDFHAVILDTRKTTPGYRFLEKRAVVHGGGENHRFGLIDRAMVKDNHLVADGGPEALQAAIDRLKSEKPDVEVELEADNLDQVHTFLNLSGVDHILLDNMTPNELAGAVMMRGDRSKPHLEASGGITFATIRDVADSGVDYISVGALTHSAPALDIGLDFEPA
jgi:nicotinate-nucleotide pyrophosphorylase (carboxylating)